MDRETLKVIDQLPPFLGKKRSSDAGIKLEGRRILFVKYLVLEI